MGDLVGTFHVDLVDQIPVGVGHLGEALVAQDAGVVDYHVDPAEVVHGALHDLLAVHHAVGVGNRSTTCGLDLFHHLQCCFAVGTFTLGAAAQIVDDDLGAMFGEQQGVGTANTTASAGYDNDLVFKTDVAHGYLLARGA